MNTVVDGKITRNPKNKHVTVEVVNEPWSLDFGASCVNPKDPEEQRVYRRIFKHKPIYLPEEYDLAVSKHISAKYAFTISMNGYSKITNEQCNAYGIKPGAYEEACKAILRQTIYSLRHEFKKTHIKLTYGASDVGVDKAIEQVGREFGMAPLGFSCARYLLYCKDDEIPVWVGANREEYADCYIQSLDLLVTTGGREQALKHDILCACIFQKRIHFVDVLGILSNTGGVPAVTIKDGKPQINNAAAAFGKFISFYGIEQATSERPIGGDRWNAVFANVKSVATDVCRRIMPSEAMFDSD
jgi:hypothetical protein